MCAESPSGAALVPHLSSHYVGADTRLARRSDQHNRPAVPLSVEKAVWCVSSGPLCRLVLPDGRSIRFTLEALRLEPVAHVVLLLLMLEPDNVVPGSFTLYVLVERVGTRVEQHLANLSAAAPIRCLHKRRLIVAKVPFTGAQVWIGLRFEERVDRLCRTVEARREERSVASTDLLIDIAAELNVFLD